jgi:hypothetical protein
MEALGKIAFGTYSDNPNQATLSPQAKAALDDLNLNCKSEVTKAYIASLLNHTALIPRRTWKPSGRGVFI